MYYATVSVYINQWYQEPVDIVYFLSTGSGKRMNHFTLEAELKLSKIKIFLKSNKKNLKVNFKILAGTYPESFRMIAQKM